MTEDLAHLGLMLSCFGQMVQAASPVGGGQVSDNKKSMPKCLVLGVFEPKTAQGQGSATAPHSTSDDRYL